MINYLIKLIPYAAIIFSLYAGIRAIKTRRFGMQSLGFKDEAKGRSAVFFGICLVLFALLIIIALLFDVDPSSNPYLQ